MTKSEQSDAGDVEPPSVLEATSITIRLDLEGKSLRRARSPGFIVEKKSQLVVETDPISSRLDKMKTLLR